MKNFVRFCVVLLAIAIFVSCSNTLQNNSGVKIDVSGARIVERAALAINESASYDIVLKLSGESQNTSIQEVTLESTGTLDEIKQTVFTFNDVRVGARVSISCQISEGRIPLWSGKTNAFVVKSGANDITLKAESLVFTQETFRALMPDYATNTSTIFEIPEGYTKIVGVNKGVNADGSPNMKSVFANWAALGNEVPPTIKIPASVVYIDAAAFCGLKDEYGYPSVQIEFEDSYGWVYTGKTIQDATTGDKFVDVEDYYSPYFREYIYNLIDGYGYIRKLDSIVTEFPISNASGSFVATDSNGNQVKIYSFDYVVPKGTTLNVKVEFYNGHDVAAEGSAAIVPETYKWYINGVLQPDQTSDTFVWDTTDFESGAYELMCVVNDKVSVQQEVRIGTR